MKSEFFTSIISNTRSDYYLRKDLYSSRILCAFGVITTPVFWLIHKSANPEVVDFLSIRIAISSLLLFIFIASYANEFVKRNINSFMTFVYYIVTIWMVYLNFLNHFSEHAIALIVVDFTVTILGLKTRFYLLSYSIMVIVLTTLACLYSNNLYIDANTFISNIATVSSISYFIASSRLKNQEEIAVREELMTTIFEESADSMLLVDPDSQQILNCNTRAIFLFDALNKKNMIGLNIDKLLGNNLTEEQKNEEYKSTKDAGFSKQLEYINKRSIKIWLDVVIKRIKIAGEPIFLVRISDITQIKQAEEALQKANSELEKRVEERTADLKGANVLLKQEISDRQRAEEQLIHTAFHDALTGLPNRSLFMDRLEHALERTKRHEDYLFAVLFLDLDRFKVVNDSLGHMVGDQLLLAITSRIKMYLRSGDTFARLGGDEFTILLDGINDVTDATRVANRIQEELRLPFNLSGHEVFTTASIGIALSTTVYERPEQILRDADTATYRAKARGKACYEVFDIAMHMSAIALLQLETDLRKALERQEFRLHYQPIVSLENRKIIGFEALIRWQHPERKLVFPADFIPVAEETGLIISIGWWVLREACRQMYLWQEQFPANPPMTISVNIPSKQFSHSDLSEQIKQILQETGLDPRTLKLELTESAIMENAESAAVMLSQLRKLGVQLSMDDFGTGYSSLSYLQRFPINMLKIDRSFISRMGTGDENWEIVQTIIRLAHNLSMSVTAEGVETGEQLALLRVLKCEYGQGYFFSKPVDSVEAAVLIAAQQLK